MAVGAAVCVLALAGCSSGGSSSADSSVSGAPAASASPSAMLMDKQTTTVLEQPLAYPKGAAAQVSSTIVELQPGQATGWHKHNVPLYAYVLEGTLTVEYDAGVTKEYPAGTAFMEATKVFHNGINKGSSVVRVLCVFIGAEGLNNTVKRP
jgi:quercetin dioxygenase-like cupin family protein